MASVRAVDFQLGNGAGANTASLAFTPDASWQVGDVAVAFFAWTNSSAFTVATGWTQNGVTLVNGANSAMAKAWKVLTSGDLTATHTFSIATSTRFVGVACALVGIAGTGTVDSSSQANATAGTTIAAPADTTSAAATFILTAWSSRVTTTSANATITPPGATHTAIAQSATAFAGSSVQAVVEVSQLTTQPTSAGTFGPYSATAGASTTTDAGMQIAFVSARAGSSMVWPNRVESTRNRAFFAVRRRPSIPVPLQDFLPQWRAPEAPPLSHARLPAIMRGRRSFVVPPQIPVPPKIPGNRIDSARSRIVAVRRGRQTTPVLTQTGPVAPTWIPRRTTPKRIVAMTAHGKRTFVLSDQAGPPRQYRASRLRPHPTRGKRTPVVTDYTGFPRQSRAAKPKLPGSRRGRQWSAATMAQPVVTVTWPPPKLGARRRLLGSATRGRQFPPTPPQIPVPKPVWPVRISSARSRSVAFRRGHRNDPPWSASIPPASRAWVPAITRQRIYSGLPIRRGYRADPAWPIEAPPSAPGFAVSTDQTVWTTYAADAAVRTGAASDRVSWVVYTTDQPLRTVDATDGLLRDATASDAEV